MLLEAIVTAATLLTGGSCAAIDNATNTMVWRGTETPLTRTTYTDEGTFLLPEARYPNEVTTLLALVHAEERLHEGAPGRKIPLSCFEDRDGVPYEITGGGLDHDHV